MCYPHHPLRIVEPLVAVAATADGLVGHDAASGQQLVEAVAMAADGGPVQRREVAGVARPGQGRIRLQQEVHGVGVAFAGRGQDVDGDVPGRLGDAGDEQQAAETGQGSRRNASRT